MFNEEFKKFVEYISLNSTWLKDVAWIILTLVATIVTILTYRNAKKSIFQPLNTEVIKHQTESFISIYNLLRGNLIEKFDYFNVFFLNFYAANDDLNNFKKVLDDLLNFLKNTDNQVIPSKKFFENQKELLSILTRYSLIPNYHPYSEIQDEQVKAELTKVKALIKDLITEIEEEQENLHHSLWKKKKN